MIIKSLKINNLRNIEEAVIRPHPRFNLLFGDNGAGKTSVLESLMILAKGRSFRSGNLSSVLGPHGDRITVFTEVEDEDGRSHTLGLERSRQDWKARIDGSNASQISELAPWLPLILMEPMSHQLVSGSPDQRRRFIDWGVFHVKHEFLDHWRRYSRALKQRNAALRSMNPSLAKSLDPQIVIHGQTITKLRGDQVVHLSRLVKTAMETLSPELSGVSVEYQPGYRTESLQEALDGAIEQDQERGSTSVGPHRAELAIRARGKQARDRLSRGEQKILAASLLISQAMQLKEQGVHPIFLLDDMASEFDRDHLVNAVNMAQALGGQVFISGVDPAPYDFLGAENMSMFHVKHGVISEA